MGPTQEISPRYTLKLRKVSLPIGIRCNCGIKHSFRLYLNTKWRSALALLKKYTIYFPGLLLNKQTDNNENLDTSLFQITEQDKDLFEFLAGRLN